MPRSIAVMLSYPQWSIIWQSQVVNSRRSISLATDRHVCQQALEHLILRAEAIYDFQPPLPPPARPWWKLWGKEPVPNISALVADLRDPTAG